MSLRLSALLLLLSTAAAGQTWVPFSVETTPVPSSVAGDCALLTDGPQSLLLGTDPAMNGLFAYDFDGGVVQSVLAGPIRGVDARTGLRFATAPRELVIASALVSSQVLLLARDAGVLVTVATRPFNVGGAGHVALAPLADGGVEVFVDIGNRTLQRYELSDDGAGHLDYAASGSISLPELPSSLAVHDRARRLYIAMPFSGIFCVDLAAGTGLRVLDPWDGGSLGGAVGGLAVYPLTDGGAVVLATVPSHGEVVAYTANPDLTYLTRFQVAADDGGAHDRQPEYLAVTPAAVPRFPRGLLVVQDRLNTLGSNYKLVRWDFAAALTTPPMPINADGGAGGGGGTAGGTGGGGTGGGGTGGGSGGGTAGGTGGGSGGSGIAGGSAGGGSGGGHAAGIGGGGDENPPGCTCGSAEAAFLPATFVLMLALSLSRRRRSNMTRT